MRSGGREKGCRARYYETVLFLECKERSFTEPASLPANPLASCGSPALRSRRSSDPPRLAAKLGASERASADKELEAAGRGRGRERGGPRRAQGESLPESDVTEVLANEKSGRGIPAPAAAQQAF